MTTSRWQNATEIAQLFLVDIWQHQNIVLARELLSPHVVRRHARSPTQGLDAYLELIAAYHRAFPGFTNEILCVTGDIHTLAVHYRSHGTHTGWWGKIPPSYRSGTIEAIDLYKLRDGQMVEIIPMWDELGIVEQLGLYCINPFYFVKSAFHSALRALQRHLKNEESK